MRGQVFILPIDMFIAKDEDPIIVLFYKTMTVVEMLLFGWIVPGRKRNVNGLDSPYEKERRGEKIKKEELRLLHHRIAHFSLGASTLRNQGAKIYL